MYADGYPGLPYLPIYSSRRGWWKVVCTQMATRACLIYQFTHHDVVGGRLCVRRWLPGPALFTNLLITTWLVEGCVYADGYPGLPYLPIYSSRRGWWKVVCTQMATRACLIYQFTHHDVVGGRLCVSRWLPGPVLFTNLLITTWLVEGCV